MAFHELHHPTLDDDGRRILGVDVHGPERPSRSPRTVAVDALQPRPGRGCQRDVEPIERVRKPLAQCLDERFLPCPSVEKPVQLLGPGKALQGLALALREQALSEVLQVVQRTDALNVYSNLAPPRHRAEADAVRVRQVEANIGPRR